MSTSTPGERVTAVVSVLVAIALLGAVVTAQQSRWVDGDDLVRLESDLRFQLDLIARFDREAHEARLAQLDEALEAWRQSMQTAADRRLLVAWFEKAIAQTVSNSSAELPPPPSLGDAPPLVVSAAPPPEDETPVTPAPELADGQDAADVGQPLADVVLPGPETAESAESAELSEPPAWAEHSIAQPLPPALDGSAPGAGEAPAEPFVLPVQVNLAELAARIRGYHQSLDDIDAELVAGGPESIEQLEALVVRLEALAARRRFLSLYYDSLTVAERRLVEPPRSMAETIEFAAGHPTAQSEEDDFLAAFAASAPDELTLGERLAALAEQFAPVPQAEAVEPDVVAD